MTKAQSPYMTPADLRFVIETCDSLCAKTQFVVTIGQRLLAMNVFVVFTFQPRSAE